ncbi:MAG: TIGR01906 family membrane protein [Candidatus Woesearchaeota archaeon]
MRSIIIAAILATALLVVLDNFFDLLYDYDFYKDEFKKNNVSLRFHGQEENITIQLIGYFRGEQLETDFFNEKEKLHLADVKELISKARVLYYLLILAVIFFYGVIMFHFRDNSLEKTGVILVFSGTAVLAFLALICIAALNFEESFVKFHEVLFRNDLWLLDPKTDNLIVMFPEEFFLDFTTSLIKKAAVSSLLLIGIGGAFIYHKKYIKIHINKKDM